MITITQKELSEYLALRREIIAQKQRADALEYRISRGLENSWWNRHRRSGVSLDKLTAMKIGLEVSIIKNLEVLEEQALMIENAIQGIEEPVLREIMRLRYLEGLEWDKLGEKIGYVSRQCLRLHRVALNRLFYTDGVTIAKTQK